LQWIRWIARGTGALVAGFWLIIGILLGIIGSEPWTTESFIMATLVIASALSVLVAWWREGLGGIMVLACAIAHSAFAYIASGHNRAFAILISGGPFFVVGILFFLSSQRDRRTEGTDL
jgi:hypothetical protein